MVHRGGGATVFECAAYVPGAKAVAINPQIVLKEYRYANEFSKITGIDLNIDILGHRNNALYFIRRNASNAYLIIVNVYSQVDMQQIENIKKKLHIDIKYGLNVYDNLIIWLYDAPVVDAHNAVEYYGIWFFIEYIIQHIEQPEMIFKVKTLYRLVNEFWREHWIMKEELGVKRRHWIQILNLIHNTNREIVVFGSGDIATQFLRDVLSKDGNNPIQIRYLLDNNIEKRGMKLEGLVIKHPLEVDQWNKLYIIIAVKRGLSEIVQQLEELGLSYKSDFIYYMDL